MTTQEQAVITAAKALVIAREQEDVIDAFFRKGVAVDPAKRSLWECAITSHICVILDLEKNLKQAVEAL